MFELQIKKQVNPVIDIDWDALKSEVKEYAKTYRNIAVVESNLSDCKQIRKDLAGQRNRLDQLRKDLKAELSKPIVAMEMEFKLLCGILDECVGDLDRGIATFDDARREEKRRYAEERIVEAINENALSSKYADRLILNDKWRQLSITEKEIALAVQTEAEILLREQRAEEQSIALIRAAVADANKLIGRDVITETAYLKQLELGVTGTEIIAQISESRNEIMNAKPEPIPEPVKEEPKKPASKNLMWVRLWVEGTEAELELLQDYLLKHFIRYEVEAISE